MQHVIDKAAHRDRGVTFYVTPEMHAALSARAAEEQRSLSNTAAVIVLNALKNSEAAPMKSGSAKVSVQALNGSD
jgi:plasmid stability protein